MMPRRADEIAAAVSGRLVAGGADTRVDGVSIDTRTLAEGELFFAIVGPHHDGHRFLRDAATAGASAAVVSTEVDAPEGLALIRVDDTTEALARLAADERRQRDLQVVAITGSSGKTTTRTFAAAAIGARYRTAASTGNLNNHWGLPLSLLRLPADTEVAVVEMGMNHAGEIAALTRIAAPDVGVITNVGRAHLGFFADVAEIAAAKAELLSEMPVGSTGVVDADSDLLMPLAVKSGRRLIPFGTSERAMLRAENVAGDLLGGARFEIERFPVALRLWGRHAVQNALAALGAARALGMPTEEAAPALGTVEALAGRGALIRLAESITLVDETYNANPSALRVVLEGLAASTWGGRRIAVLGDMLELGEHAAACHREIGEAAARSGVDLLLAVGEHAAEMIDGAAAGGLEQTLALPDAEAAASEALRSVRAGDLVLIKGSRGVRLEVVRDALCDRFPARNAS